MHPEDRKRFLADREGILATSSSVDAIRDGVEGQYRIARPDGSEIWLEQIARIMRDQDGRAIRLVGTDQDITERKRTEQDLRISDERFRFSRQQLLAPRTIDPGALVDEMGDR